jgi:uncharacterized protein YegL
MVSPLFAVTVVPEVDAIAYDERSASFVIRIDPPAAPDRRPPLRLVLALDTSGSMQGEKLRSALASAQAVIRALSPDDTFACVTFDSTVTELLPPTRMTASGKAMTQARMANVAAAGNTDLATAMLRSLASADGGRVLLLTDGCPTEGVSDPDQLVQLLKGAARGSTLSTFGFGPDVNPLLLLALSEAGQGNYTFIEPGEPPLSAIAAELGGLMHTVAAQASLVVVPSEGVRLDRFHRATGLTLDSATGAARLDMASLIAEEPVYLALDLSWAEHAIGRPLAVATLTATRTDNGESIARQAVLTARAAQRRGLINQEAARELILGRASVGLHQASHAPARARREVASKLTELRGELRGAASAAALERDPQVGAALSMLKDALEGLEATSDAEVHSSRHGMVTGSMALSQKRNTSMGLAGAAKQASFVSASQRAGWNMIKGSNNGPDKDS